MTTPSGRDRIVASALELFAERGYDAVSLRDVAAHAEVSLALIPHHFGSKEGLRAAVDEHVAGVFDDLANAPAEGDHAAMSAGMADVLLAHIPEGSPIPAYVRRLLLTGDPAGKALFRRWYTLSQHMLADFEAAGVAAPARDAEMRAAMLLVNDLAFIILADHIHDATGVDPLTPDGLQRWTADLIDAYTHGAFRKEPQ